MSIPVACPFLGRLLDYGTVVVKGTGGTEEPFRDVRAPLEFQRAAQAQAAAVRQV